LIQGLFFLPGVAAVDDVARSSAACAGDFIREGGVRGMELAGDPDAVYSRRVELVLSDAEPFGWF
jgi:hypothetical protein